ncbi:MAG: T9SS type A sorting domain-containing protein, partial [Ignavibacteria bacterium]|nr:T9SS type A sorting domain-containing protein [Ignavibacteria bacterium]
EWQPPGITTSIIHNVELYGNYLFAAHYTAGLRIIDVTEPYLPVEKAYYDTYPPDNGFTFNGCWGVYIFPSEKIVASDRSTGLYVFRTDFPLNYTPPQIPNEFRLIQNYPNPFNQNTTIRVELPENVYLNLTVYSSSGQKVMTLADGFTLKGTKYFSFNAENYSSGVYFCKMTVRKYPSGFFTSAVKMVLLK